MLRLRRMFRPIKNGNYRLYFFGLTVSTLGSWLQSVAQAWLAHRFTGPASKSPDVVRIHPRPDAISLLSVADHCRRSVNFVNVVVADKQVHLVPGYARSDRALH